MDPRHCPPQLLKNGLGQAALFSAIPLQQTELGRSWERLAALAHQEFPKLKLDDPRDLHITLVYLGRDWPATRLEELSAHSLIGLEPGESPWESPLKMGTFGWKGSVSALESDPPPIAWKERIIAARLQLNRLGLRKPDRFDRDFRIHITLARAADPIRDVEETKRFQSWMLDRIREDPGLQTLKLTSEVRPILLVSWRLDRSGPKYIPLSELLQRLASESPSPH